MAKEKSKFPDLSAQNLLTEDAREAKRLLEQLVFLSMAAMYCQKHQHAGRKSLNSEMGISERVWQRVRILMKRYPKWKTMQLCPACLSLLLTVHKHTDRCRQMSNKTFCHLCPTYCYPKLYDETLSALMRETGSQLIRRHPLLALRLMLHVLGNKRRVRRHFGREAKSMRTANVKENNHA